jgi:hypothetical protein
MQPKRKRLSEAGALGALLGLIAGLVIRWLTDGGLVAVLLSGIIGIATGVAISIILRRV